MNCRYRRYGTLCLNDNFICACAVLYIQVAVIGDGRSEVVTVAGDKLWSSDALVKIGEEVTLPADIKQTRSALSKRVFE